MIEDKDIVYYIINSAGVIVTGIFSFLIWRATKQSAEAAKLAAEAARDAAKTAEWQAMIKPYNN